MRSRSSTWVAVRRIATVVAICFVIKLLLPQLGQLGDALGAARRARWPWLLAAGACAGATYVAAAFALSGAAARALPLRRTTAVQLAAAFTNRLVPAGLGGMATNVRYLVRSGSTTPAAVTAVGLNSVAGFLVHLVAAVLVLPLVGWHAGLPLPTPPTPHLPDSWPLLLGAVTVLTLVVCVLGAPALYRRLAPVARDAACAMLTVLRRPRHAIRLFSGSAGVTAFHALALVASLRAFGVRTDALSVLGVFLAGSAVGSVVPTPGGLGGLEAALVSGLAGFHAPTGAAIAGVLGYRLVTYWLPIVPGAVAWRALRRRRTL